MDRNSGPNTALLQERPSSLRVTVTTRISLHDRLRSCAHRACGGFLHLRDGVAALLTPSLCRLCSLPLLRADAYPVCERCMQKLRPTQVAVCWKCGDAIGLDDQHASGIVRRESLRCAECMADEPAYLRAASFGTYRGALRQLIHLYKFDAVRPLAAPLAQRLALAMADAVYPNREYTVIAVPLFRGRRDFNQSALLADAAVRSLAQDQPELRLAARHDLLRRTRATESQSHLTPDQRKKNVRGAFAVTGDVSGRPILLVDDVYTTGATAAECSATLLRAGAASVTVVTLARAHMRDAVPDAQTFAAATRPWTLGLATNHAAETQDRNHTAEMGERR